MYYYKNTKSRERQNLIIKRSGPALEALILLEFRTPFIEATDSNI